MLNQSVNNFDNYIVQKMYVQEELGAFKSSEVRLKQLMLRLKEQEKANQELKS